MRSIDLKKVAISFYLLLGLSLFSLGNEENDPFQIGDLKVGPGESKSGYLSVPEKDGVGCLIPLTIINGEPLFEVGRVKQK